MPPDRATLLYFCDETSIGEDYMAVGGLAIRRDRATELAADIHAINKAYGVKSEVKWATVKKRRTDVHKAYVNYLFTLVENKQAHLHIRFSPFKEYDHKASGPRRETDTVSKAYYQLLLHRVGRYYGGKHDVLVRPDNGDCTSYLRSMRDSLNGDIHGRFGGQRVTVVDVECRPSHVEPFLQLLDVTLGAFGSFRNARHLLATGSAPKRELAEYAVQRSGLHRLSSSTHMDARVLNVWNVKPQGPKVRSPRR
jgi:hypothetical protein